MAAIAHAPVTVVVRRRARSPLAGFFLLLTVASLGFISWMLYSHPQILAAGLADISKGLLVQLPMYVQDWGASVQAHATAFWGSFAGGVVVPWLLGRSISRACRRRLLFLLTMLVTLPLAALVLYRQWNQVVELFQSIKPAPHP